MEPEVKRAGITITPQPHGRWQWTASGQAGIRLGLAGSESEAERLALAAQSELNV